MLKMMKNGLYLDASLPRNSVNMAMVSEFLKQAWFMDNQEQECIVSIISF